MPSVMGILSGGVAFEQSPGGWEELYGDGGGAGGWSCGGRERFFRQKEDHKGVRLERGLVRPGTLGTYGRMGTVNFGCAAEQVGLYPGSRGSRGGF